MLEHIHKKTIEWLFGFSEQPLNMMSHKVGYV